MPTLLEYKCPSCGGALSFDSSVQKLACPYCDTQLDVETLKELDEVLNQPSQEDIQWTEQERRQWTEQEQEHMRCYVCNSCGGQIITADTTAATECPYCGNPVVMAGNLSGALKPDLVVPFRLDKKAAKDALRKHLTGKKLLPKMFKDENRIDKIQGVYVPFWLFDAEADGQVNYRATRVRSWSDSRYNHTETLHFLVQRAGDLAFAGIPVDGSSKMPDDLMESIEPYDLSQAVDFQTAYLAGYLADRYDVTVQDSQTRAAQRIRASVEDSLLSTVIGYHTVLPQNENIRLKSHTARYALLPVWMLNTHYRGKTYTFAMNGQTGRFVGDLPVDKGAFWRWFALTGVGAALLSYLVALAIHFL